jgi:YfiH family protein
MGEFRVLMSEIRCLQFSSLQSASGLHHAITTRHGGCSRVPYESLNLGYHVNDDALGVSHNRKSLANLLRYEATQLVAAQQVHGARIQIVDANSCGSGALDWDSALPETDALIVTEPNVPVIILVADCAPLLLVDKKHRVLAVVHAGWRGAVSRIASQTVDTMHRTFGSKPQQIRVGIGPCLCADCFEVGDEVTSAARAMEPASIVSGHSKPHVDLRMLLRSDLQSAGVLASNIETMLHCPRCDTQTFFSHRGEQGTTGRFGLVAWWQ